MRLVPEDKVGKIDFYKSRIAKWAANAPALGVSPERIASMAAKIEAAESARLEQVQAVRTSP